MNGSPRLRAPLALFGLAILFACGDGGFQGASLLPLCGGFGPTLGGVTLDLAKGTPTLIRAGERLSVSATVGAPIDVTPPSRNCPSTVDGHTHFSRVTWSWPADDQFEVQLVSCPCTPDRSWDDQGRRYVAAAATGPGLFVFHITGRMPGLSSFDMAGYLSGPCGGRDPSDPIGECGPFASDSASIRVIE